jgi:lipopolysaccharide exporter
LKLSNLIRKIISDQIVRIKGTDLKAKSARAAMALGLGTVVERGLRLVRNMILARLLAPDQFGLMAIVMVAASVFEAFVEIGVRQSVIQNKGGADPEYLNVAWWFQAIRGLGLFAIALLAAPLISSFYGNPELLRLVQVAVLAILFRGLISPRAYVLEKEYRFGWVVFLVQGSGVLGTVTAVVLAFIIKNVWALVIGFVAEFAIMCVLSYVIVPFKPSFKMHRKHMGELFKFARGMFGLPILTIFAVRTDVVVLGKVVLPEQLGMYALAAALAGQPGELFTRVVGRVLFPAFAEKQDNKQALCRAVLRMTRATVVFGVPLIAVVAIFAGPILSFVYTPKYAVVAVPFRIMCATMFVGIQRHILGTMYLAIGRPHLHRRFVGVLAILIACLIYPGIAVFGLVGAATVLLLANAVAVFMQVVCMRRVIGLRFREYAFCWLPLPLNWWKVAAPEE